VRVALYGRYVVRDRDGRVIKRSPWRRDPLLLNFAKLLAGTLSDHALSRFESLIDTNGATRPFPDFYGSANPFARVTAPAGETRFGILFGSGTTSVSLTDYRLESILGIDVLDYGATTLHRARTVNNRAIVEITRSATAKVNVTVSEVGLAVNHFDFTQAHRFFLLARTVLSTPISLSAGQILTWYYRLRISM